MTEFGHKPVMPAEVLEGLDIKPDGTYVDGTIGGAGHSGEIYRRLGPQGMLLGIDKDSTAVETARDRLSRLDGQARYAVVKSDFRNIAEVCSEQGIRSADGILLDLGVSSHQLDTPERGFSFKFDTPLDMRMDRESTLTAEYVVNTYDEARLKKLIYEYGEERWAARIAKYIAERRKKQPVKTAADLAEIIKSAVPKGAWQDSLHPATRTFQAIRIEVNDELSFLPAALNDCMDILGTGGRLCVITFHSLEDRIVKQTFNEMVKPCKCPPDFPKCVCGAVPKGEFTGPKMTVASEDEIAGNPRARSAKLRVIRKV